jgi:hypothetical protein
MSDHQLGWRSNHQFKPKLIADDAVGGCVGVFFSFAAVATWEIAYHHFVHRRGLTNLTATKLVVKQVRSGLGRWPFGIALFMVNEAFTHAFGEV